MAHATPPGDPVRINLSEWTGLACGLPSKNSFVEGAVDLARAIARRLCRTRLASSAGIRLEDRLAPENVIVYVERRPPPSEDPSAAARPPSIADVQFQFEASSSGAGSPPPPDDDPSLLPRTDGRVRLALGRILLEIFSMGNASSVDVAGAGAATKNDDGSAGAKEERPPGAAKKRPAAPPATGGPPSERAKNLLLSLGMPVSICQLVGDLLDTGNDESRPDSSLESLEDILGDENEDESRLASAVTSVDEVVWDLTQMKASPQKFLFDRSCPRRALEDTSIMSNTHDHLIGRESEMSVLMTMKYQVSVHVRSEASNIDSVSIHRRKFLSDAIFLSGYAGSGKSSILNAVTNACNEDGWFVLGCKFDKQSDPHTILAKAFDDFFGTWGAANCNVHPDLDTEMVLAFNKVCEHILTTMDNEGLRHLANSMPNFAKSFPLLSLARNNHSLGGISSMDKVGSGKKRLQNMFHVLLDSLCSVGRPVLFALDDLQWSNSSVMNDVADFVANYVHYSSGGADRLGRRGILIAGAYRSNEVKESDDLIKSIDFMKKSGRVNVTVLTVGKLSNVDVTKLLSAKLCLPWRHTRGLADLVHAKTRGNPFFVAQFLRSIVQNKMLSFSVKRRRWVWDCDTVDMQVVSEGVAELLAASFCQLPPTLMLTLKVVSCLGSQVEESVIEALDSGNKVLTFDMQRELPLAVDEGILEKAGPIYQFTHDIILSSIYETISPQNQQLLHKTIGEDLLKRSADNPTMYVLAVDQINMFCKDGNPNAEERLLFSESNATAAKHALASSSFDQARLYIDMGKQLLENDHWQTQYSLSLDLYEMAASVSFMNGEADKVSVCLNEISAHAKSFDDLLKASSVLIKLLTSSSKYEQARSNCLMVLSNLGEEFPQELCPPLVFNELTSMWTTLRGITADQFKLLPPMADRNKLNVMKFLNMLCMCSLFSTPLLLPLAGCRMVKLTMQFGFCEDSIVGLATVALSVFHITDNIQLASHLGQVCESLIEEGPRKHILRSRLCNELATVLKVVNEPVQSIIARLPGLYNSAMLAGDSENAMICRSLYCGMSFYSGGLGIVSASNAFQMCLKEADKYQQTTVLHSMMTFLNICLYLSGGKDNVKSLEELNQIGEETNNAFLLYQVFMSQVTIHFWFREYIDVVELSGKLAAKNPSSLQQKRILHFFRSLYEGIAYLSLARDTKQVKWKIQGEKSVVWYQQMESMSKWNFENKSKLLQAELHYVDGDIESAEAFYEASIESACNHRFIHEEALACELYGVFCIENKMFDKGSKQLRVALEKYKQWGAMKKAAELERFIGAVDHTNNAYGL